MIVRCQWSGEACGPADADGAEACCRSSAVADALGTGVSPTVGGGVASGTAIEDDPAAGSDGGRLVYSRPAGQTAPKGVAPGDPLVRHSVAAGAVWQAAWSGICRCTAATVCWPSLHSKSPTQYKEATGTEKNTLHVYH